MNSRVVQNKIRTYRFSLVRVSDQSKAFSTMNSLVDKAIGALSGWYETRPRSSSGGGLPSKGSVAVGLVLLERLKTTYDLDLNSHLAKGGAQIKGASGAAVKKILADFGEYRPFVSEGGRTNRGSPADARALLEALRHLDLDQFTQDERSSVLRGLQSWLVDRVREFHNQERIKPVYIPSQSTRQFVAEILSLAKEKGKHGPVAQYLVGAKLALRFPEVRIRNESYSAADDPSGQPGDFVVGDTTFHVTVAPSTGHFEKCRRNLEDGRRVFLLVPESVLIGTRQNAENVEPGRIAVESIETFIAQNIEEISIFTEDRLVNSPKSLLDTYNKRVDTVDIDKSMMIDVPRNLAGPGGDT